jgi:hypothetical protein
MIHPTPRADRWDPWILAALCIVALTTIIVLQFM